MASSPSIAGLQECERFASRTSTSVPRSGASRSESCSGTRASVRAARFPAGVLGRGRDSSELVTCGGDRIQRRDDLVDRDDEALAVVVGSGVLGAIGMKAVIPSMLKAGGGSIVNISSVAGLVAIVGAPSLAYTGSKFAVRGMTKQVAVEYGAKKIRVNTIHPGYIKTPMMAAATDAEGGGAVSQIPLGRLAEPSEVSYLALFLASDESSYITGMEHVVDGGITAA